MSGYREVAGALRAAIEAGHYAPGDTLPNQNDIAAEHSVNIHTVRKAVDLLADEGYVQPIRRRGTVVLDRSPATRLAEAVQDLREQLGVVGPDAVQVDVSTWSLRVVLDAVDQPSPVPHVDA